MVLEKLCFGLVSHAQRGDSRTGAADKRCYVDSLLIMKKKSVCEPKSCDDSVDRSTNWYSSISHTPPKRSCTVDEHVHDKFMIPFTCL